jgi:hypothetical protein
VHVRADLDRVVASCDGKLVADHPRSWARHQTFTDPEHTAAAAVLRRSRFGITRTVDPDPGQLVQVRDLATYDAAFGIEAEGAAS